MEVGRKQMTDMLSEERGLHLKETELCLGLPGGGAEAVGKTNGKRGFLETVDLKLHLQSKESAAGADHYSPTTEKNLLPRTKDPVNPPAK